MNRNLKPGAARAVAFLLVTAGAAWSQSYQGGLRGVIQDPGRAVIAGAKVALVDQATNAARSVVSNGQGEYVFIALEPANYALRVEAPGFKRFERQDVSVGTQEFLTLDLKLELGSATESVTVTAEVALIDTSNASNGQVIDSQKIADLPNLGRNVFLLAKLSTNVVPVGDPRFNRFQDQSGSSQISIAGGPIRGNK